MTSLTVRSLGYDAEARVLEVEFHDGGVYRYLCVPEAEARALVRVGSVGGYLNAVIKPRYEALRVSAYVTSLHSVLLVPARRPRLPGVPTDAAGSET